MKILKKSVFEILWRMKIDVNVFEGNYTFLFASFLLTH
jgi:hypothetical protein